MAHVPAAAATATTNPISRRETASGNISRPAAERGDKSGNRTFREVMQKAGEKTGDKKTKPSGEKIKLPLSLRFTSLKSTKKSGRQSGLVAKTLPRQKSTAVVNTGETLNSVLINNDEKKTVETETADNGATVQTLHNNLNLPVSADTPTPVKTSNIKATKKDRKKKISANHGSAGVKKTQIGNRSNLSSKSSKVEVIDNRFSAAAPLNTEVDNIDGDISNINISDVQHQKASHIVKNSSHGKTADSVRLEQSQNITTAVSEIKLTSRGDGTAMQKSAASELAAKLDAQAGNEIVRQVKVVLNNANSGEVRINLRPDNLGQVKIRIHLVDNRLTGRIFVESAAAREAFRNALDGLQTRLVESGFGSADLEMSWDDSPGEFMQNKGDSGKQNGNPDEAIREFDSNIPAINNSESAESRINMVV